MHEGGAQEGRARGQGRDAGDYFQVEVNLIGGAGGAHFEFPGGAHLEDEAGHAVNTGIAATHQGHGVAGQDQVQGGLAALHFGLHAGGHHLFMGEQGGDQVHVGLVAHHHPGGR